MPLCWRVLESVGSCNMTIGNFLAERQAMSLWLIPPYSSPTYIHPHTWISPSLFQQDAKSPIHAFEQQQSHCKTHSRTLVVYIHMR
jgi:hypothetical protein